MGEGEGGVDIIWTLWSPLPLIPSHRGRGDCWGDIEKSRGAPLRAPGYGGHACAPKRYSAQARRAAPTKLIRILNWGIGDWSLFDVWLLIIGDCEFKYA
jgi:hypothetical protein